jgi:histidinol-phosphate phosphatase family protein
VFADRDGTLIVERDYLADPDGVSLIPGVPRALADLRAAGFPVVVISNQSGVGRGRFTLARAYEVMARLRERLRVEGVELDAIYLCPHRPEEACACRKPGTALLERAAEDLQLTLARSFMVGDKRIDVETAARAGGRGVLVRTGYGREEELRPAAPDGADAPAFVAEDFATAAAWILAHEEPIESR